MRRETAVLTLVVTLLIAVSGLAVVVALDRISINEVTGRLAQSAANQSSNRAHNVSVWCNAINTSRDYNRGFVRKASRGHIRYTLHDLPCLQLEQATRNSLHP